MSGQLTTHVVDTAHGRPSAGLRLELWRMPAEGAALRSVLTNAQGRTDQPLLSGEDMQVGRYQLRFFVADYFRAA
ncbi:MAG TPA: hydroxyisourate hydrolase, partial [Chloroflexota bacterium]|nr:hydroxyisourate hydrolase [Chloroflexota bacterium]